MNEIWCDAGEGFHPASAMDYLPVPQLRDLQLRRLKAVTQRCYDHVPLFRQRMDERKVKPSDIKHLEDIVKLPYTEKTDLRDTYPFGLFASSMDEIVRLHASSGTTGKPIVVAYTPGDVQTWAGVMVRSFAACGLHRGDVIQNSYGYGLFTGGLGAHYGAEALGATVIPVSGGNTHRQIMVLKDFKVTAICCTPSYFLHLIDQCIELKVNIRDLPLRVGVFGAEPWTEQMRERIKKDSGITPFDIYGLSEIIGPGVAIECPHHDGLHMFEDHFYPEIINIKTGKPCKDGEEGELVITTLSKEAMPMIRYRTHDISRLHDTACPCGRTIRRIERIARRSDDMLIIRGVNLFPSQIETALLAVEGTLPHYQIILTRDKGLDNVEVQVEVTPELFSDRISEMEGLSRRLGNEIEHTIGLRVALRLVAPGTIPRSEGKAKRVIDRRNEKAV